MAVFGRIVFFLLILALLGFKRAKLIISSLTFAAFLILVSAFSDIGVAGNTVLWIVFVALAIIFNYFPLRRFLFSSHIIKIYRKQLPPMSLTEKEALAAGAVGWESELFTGMPNWDKLRSIPKATLTDEERAFLDGPVETLCAMISNWEISQRLFEIPKPIWDHCKQHGFFGLIIPKKYGGKEFSALAHSQVIAKLSAASIAVATVVSVPNSLGPAELLLRYGTDEQKKHYLPRLADGREIPCFALTSPLAGSDASAIEDHGVVCKKTIDGKETLGILLNWNKRYITLSPIATLLGLAFKLYDPENLLGEKKSLGITCALVPVSTPGVVTGRRHFPLCCAFPNGPTQGKDVFVPLSAIIGGPSMAGHGWRMLMESLAAGRSISLPSMVAGGVKKVIYAGGAYARIRRQFNIHIGAFGGVQEALARIGGHAFLAEATRLFTVAALNRGEHSAVASAISKCHTTELSRRVLADAMDIHGGKGVCMGPHNYLAQSYIEGPISITVEGANILTRSMIIFGQGAIRCHPYVLKEMRATENQNKKEGLKEFDKALFAHLGLIISNTVRSLLLGLSGGYFERAPKGDLKRYYQRFSQFSAAFSLVSDIAMLSMGAKLKRKEKLSGRLSDLLSYLYMGSAAMKYYELQNEKEALPFLRWSCDELLYLIQKQLDEFLLNFPHRGLSYWLRAIVFPWGKRLKPPSDKLSGTVAESLLYPSRVRELLTNHLYTKNIKNNPIGLIASVLEKVIQTEPLEKKLYKAVKTGKIVGKTHAEKIQHALASNIINQEEAKQLTDAFEARMSVINVDDFSSDELTSKYISKTEN